MTKYREILRLHSQGISNRSIAAACQCSRNTVAVVLKQARIHTISWPLPDDVSDGNLQAVLFPDRRSGTNQKVPDCEYLHKELAKSGVTLSLLWNEYCEACRLNGEIPYMYSQFCRYYRKYAQTTKATMRISRKPGELMEVDWAGTTVNLINDFNFEASPAYVFVASLACSQYTYVEAFPSMKAESWIQAHINAFNYFGGVTRILVPDNLKTGVEKASKYDPIINKTYQEMAEHYGSVVIPARIRKPRDKPNAEGAVGIITTWIIAALRHQQFFSLTDLNRAIHEKLIEFNERPFQKKEGSRLSAFRAEEKHFLMPLPASPYVIATWMKATVQYDYHINVEKMHYSVPYEYIKSEVDIRVTSHIIETFYEGNRIASHKRLKGQTGQRITLPEHMPDNHKKYLEWNTQRFIEWAEHSGPSILITVKSILASHKVEQQGYRSAQAFVKLADQYSIERLEAACARALTYSPSPSLKSVKTILKTGQDKLETPDEVKLTTARTSEHSYTRGADYYGGKKYD